MIRTVIDHMPGRLLWDEALARDRADRLDREARANAPYPLRPLITAGFLSLLAWAGAYLLFFSHTLWGAPSLVPDRWSHVFYPIEQILPGSWVHAHLDSLMGLANAAIWLALVAALMAAWLWALRAAGRLPGGDRWLEREGLRIALAGLVCFSLILVFSPGFTSQDLYSTIFYAKIAGVYGASPYTSTPNLFAGLDVNNWLQWVYWKDQPCVYGPAWVLPAALLARLAEAIDGDIVTYLMSQRLLSAAVNIGNTLLIWHLAGRLWPGQPGRRLAAVLFYAWCPLVVWEFANNGHNDALLIFWVLVAVWCHLQGRVWARGARAVLAARGWRGPARPERRTALNPWWLAAVGALTLAGLTKASGFLLVPAYLVLVWRLVSSYPEPRRQRRRFLLAAGGVGLGLTTLLYLPYWDGPATLAALLHAPGNERYANSLGLLIHNSLSLALAALGPTGGLAGTGWSPEAVGAALDPWLRAVLMGSAALAGLVLTLRVRDIRSWLLYGGWLLAAYTLIGTTWLWPWYLTWIMPLAALAGPGRLRNLLVLGTIGGMVFYIQ